jgi:hypothetical protein
VLKDSWERWKESGHDFSRAAHTEQFKRKPERGPQGPRSGSFGILSSNHYTHGCSMGDENSNPVPLENSECVVPGPSLPLDELHKYLSESDPHSARDIARYVEIEAADETVLHVEKVKSEVILGGIHEVWDVHTDKNRWWVISPLTNLYSQKHFLSLDYTLSFHVGLMMRLRSRPQGPDSNDPTPFDDVFRRREQAERRFESAVEAEDYQSVGMQLRECLICLCGAIRRRIELQPMTEVPQDSNFIAWSSAFADHLCPGESNKELRQFLKGSAKDTWQLVNWLTHHRNANETACSIALNGCGNVIGHFIQILERSKREKVKNCPLCRSRDVRTHFDPFLGSGGDYYMSCGVCEWTDRKQNDTEPNPDG